jgi:hypothetical protein
MITFLTLLALVLPVGVHDETYLPLMYSGTWTSVLEINAYGASHMTTETGSLTFNFVGDSFAVYGFLSPLGGSADVCVDEDCVPVSWEGNSSRTAEIVAIYDLSPTSHTVTISALGDGVISIDAVYIAPAPPTESEAPAYIEFNEDKTGVLENRITAGDQSIFAMLVVLVITSFVGVILQVWKGS